LQAGTDSASPAEYLAVDALKRAGGSVPKPEGSGLLEVLSFDYCLFKPDPIHSLALCLNYHGWLDAQYFGKTKDLRKRLLLGEEGFEQDLLSLRIQSRSIYAGRLRENDFLGRLVACNSDDL
jgi:hypothetical protein